VKHAQASKIIIVKRKKKGHGGHHGGAWKVAYADFVTAMMAFFMVMWILGMDQQLKQAVEGYFSNPVGFKKGYSGGSSPMAAGSSPARVRTNPVALTIRNYQQKRFSEVSNVLRGKLDSIARIGGLTAHIEIVVTDAGLRIELIENETGDAFFPSGSAQIKPVGRATLEVIAHELVGLENPIIIEGHTDAAKYGTGGYSNWELSGDRANAARRVLETTGLPPGRIVEVTGHADRILRNPANPLDPTNRRITLMLPFVQPPDLKRPPEAGDSIPALPNVRRG
jgi:chemotaxis protein MotB